jgi:hypothetical protein
MEQEWWWWSKMAQYQQVDSTAHETASVSSICVSRFRLLTLVEINFFTFFFFFDIFFSTRNTQIGTPQSITSIRCKMWSIENHDCSPKPMPKLQSPKQLPSVIFFAFLFSACIGEAVKHMCKISRAFQKAQERLNQSSERKVMPVLRSTLRVRFLWWRWWIRCESGGMKNRVAAADKGNHTTEPKHNLNQQQKNELGHKLNTTDSKRESCKRLNTALGRGKPNRLHNLFLAFQWTIGRRQKQG